MFGKKKTPRPKEDSGVITEGVIPDPIQRRAEQVIALGSPTPWIDQTLYLIGSNVTHHQKGDPLLDEAVTSAQALLALLVEMKRQEEMLAL